MNSTFKSLLVGGGLTLLMIPATTGIAVAASDDHARVAPAVMAFDQRAAGKAVTISYVHLPKSGYLVIYGSDSNGKPSGDPLGTVALKSGDHRNLKVDLKAEPASNTRMWAALYEDKDGDAKLDKTKDIAFWPGGKLPFENRFQIE